MNRFENNPTRQRLAQPSHETSSEIGEAVRRIMESDIRLYEATEAFLASSVARISAAAYGVANVTKDSFLVRASVPKSGNVETCTHVVVEVNNGADDLGGAWVWFERGTCAGKAIPPEEIRMLKELLRSGNFRLDVGNAKN